MIYLAVVNKNYMDLGDYEKKPASNKPIRKIPAPNSKLGSGVAASGATGALKSYSSGMQSGGGSSGSGSGGSGGYTAPSAEDSYAAALEDYYDRMEAAIRRQQREAERAMKAKIQQGVNTLESQKPALGQQFQDSAQQAYIQYMRSQKALPQMMAAQGLSGGASESSLAGLEASYGNNVNALRNSYNQAINDIDTDIANLRASGDISLAENAGDYSQKLFELAAQQQADQLALLKKAGSAAGSANSPAQLTYTQALEAYNNGNRTPGVLNTLRNYYQDSEWGDTESTPDIRSWQSRFDSPGFRNMYQERGVAYEDAIAREIYNAVANGTMTREQAEALARVYGFTFS